MKGKTIFILVIIGLIVLVIALNFLKKLPASVLKWLGFLAFMIIITFFTIRIAKKNEGGNWNG